MNAIGRKQRETPALVGFGQRGSSARFRSGLQHPRGVAGRVAATHHESQPIESQRRPTSPVSRQRAQRDANIVATRIPETTPSEMPAGTSMK